MDQDMLMREYVSRDEFRDLKAYAQRTHHDRNNLALIVEGQRVEIANQKESLAEAWKVINTFRTTVGGIVAGSAIIQTVVVAFIVYKITH